MLAPRITLYAKMKTYAIDCHLQDCLGLARVLDQ